jgi:DNA-binding HxlR family transcriptional regulator
MRFVLDIVKNVMNCVEVCYRSPIRERGHDPFFFTLYIFAILTLSIYTHILDSAMRQRRHESYELSSGCAVEACLEVIGGKWKGVILHHLMTLGVLRFNQIQRLKPNLSPRILTAQLRELEQDGVIVRKVYPVVPPKVEYSLSKAGESLKPLIKAMQDWGDEYLVRTNAPISSRAKASPQRNEEASKRQFRMMKSPVP